MDIREVPMMVNEVLASCGLDAAGWRFAWSRSHRAFGTCNYTHRLIKMSKPLCEVNTPERVRETVLHEVGHALAGYLAYHGPTWRAACQSIGLAEPQRRWDHETTMPALRPRGYRQVCPGCGMFWDRVRALRPGTYLCRCRTGGQRTKLLDYRIEDGMPLSIQSALTSKAKAELVRKAVISDDSGHGPVGGAK